MDKFVLFADCIPVKGWKRSLLCDTRNGKQHLIPNTLYHILEDFSGKSVDFVKEFYEHKHDSVIDEYFTFLRNENLIFFTEQPQFFPRLNLELNSPVEIDNAILDFDQIQYDFRRIISELDSLKCSNLQLRFFSRIWGTKIDEIVDFLETSKSRIISVDFIVPFDETYPEARLERLIKKSPRIHSILCYNSPQVRMKPPIWKEMGYLIFSKEKIIDEKSCGNISTNYFFSNLKLISESQKYNTCLNKKVSVDKNGNIKNCPSFKQSFGNVNNTSLKDAILKKDFKQYWNINKDSIEVCKDCEFRHVCTDCRAYIEEPSNRYSKPLKCGYNPYDNTWEVWSDNPLKSSQISHYELHEVI